ncbi:MAG: repressor LexA [Kosmotogales bacterium]|nr:repressor LexA [Kosmotogales bacterium]
MITTVLNTNIICYNKGEVITVGFGKNLKRIRKMKNYTQQKLSEKLNIPRTTITMWETERHEPGSTDIIIELSRILNCTPNDLLGYNMVNFENSEKIESQNLIPVLGRVAAGSGVICEEDIIDYIKLPHFIKVDFCLQIAGDSMEPTLNNGDIIGIKIQSFAPNNAISIVRIRENEGVVKRFSKTANGIILTSDNPGYSPIIISPSEWENECGIVGVVVGRWQKI